MVFRMRYVGVDLAWGTRNMTGLAVLDESHTLVDLVEGRTDEQIEAWLRRWTDGPCLVAFDAPLIVTNAGGSRACERLVGRHFGAYQASCYPSSLATPHFADGGRAARLAKALGLDTTLGSTQDRRAIEVYPHPAMIVLFGLSTVLRYKKRSRFDLRKVELTRLVDLVETLDLRLGAQWAAIRTTVEEAQRQADLNRVEDRVDAVVCAYVAAYTQEKPDAVRHLGDHDGFIVTPVTPEMASRIPGP